ncbi:MAG TPA: histidine kinase dimerization/phosphoacceptor domain -containing protein [Caulobacteraceae bacterium]|nr:histidine kinase dimerization/phosphoacceptor domain -containing protein [Caulobacteraceae bacterium]
MATHTPILAEAAHSLTLAVVASSAAPLLLLDGEFVVIAASLSFCQAFHISPSSVVGRPLFALGAGEWDIPQLRSLLAATARGDAEIPAYEMDLAGARGPRRLVLHASLLDWAQPEDVRLLVSVADVTDARQAEKLRDDMLREKAVLLQELQHRVANSLQIIASVLLQSARHVQSAETRAHLLDAHQRVMSVGALQKELTASSLGEVQLRTYFAKLCDSLGASMIRDHDQLSLEVDADDTVATADVSVSLGLIVTELVINALKHAFPDRRHGRILVRYRSAATGWALSVHDDGVGIPTGPAKPGLGTSIVEALAKQLGARVELAAAHPGVAVSIVHP